MLKEIDVATVERLKLFFFDCMLNGSLGDAPRQDVPGMPGYRKIEFEEGDLKFMDLYTRNLGTGKSHGLITIWLGNQPMWMMSANGEFERRALPILKDALRKSYEAREFRGGRGPACMEALPLRYTNENSSLVFEGFSGHETTWERDPEEKLDNIGLAVWHDIGSQRYQGGLLVHVSR